MGAKTKIDWCDSSWNPVTGCYHDCPYCYARGIAKRFGNHLTEWKCRNIHDLEEPIRKKAMPGKIRAITPFPHDFEPTLHRYKFHEPLAWKHSRDIFVCSMADLFGEWVPDEWIETVFDRCKAAPQHRYFFLTKNPARYVKLYEAGIMPTEDNFWYGTSVTNPATPYFYSRMPDDNPHTFLSIEPIHMPFHGLPVLPEWVIVGAETGNRRDRPVPEKSWLDDIIRACRTNRVPLFMKESLREIMGADFVQEKPGA